MSDIFISYDSADRERVRPLVEVLEGQGWTVWWDRRIPPGRSFAEVIAEKLGDAKCILLIWTATSVLSKWVRKEAAEADRRGILVPVLYDDVEIPFEFRDIHGAGLLGYPRSAREPELKELLTAVAGLVGRPLAQVSAAVDEVPHPERETKRMQTDPPPSSSAPGGTGRVPFLRGNRIALVLAVLAVVGIVGVWITVSNRPVSPTNQQESWTAHLPRPDSPPEQTLLCTVQVSNGPLPGQKARASRNFDLSPPSGARSLQFVVKSEEAKGIRFAIVKDIRWGKDQMVAPNLRHESTLDLKEIYDRNTLYIAGVENATQQFDVEIYAVSIK